MYVCISLSLYIYIYLHIYIYICLCIYLSLSLYIYIYICLSARWADMATRKTWLTIDAAPRKKNTIDWPTYINT